MSRLRRSGLCLVLAGTLFGCTDPAAVNAFSNQAPPPASFKTMMTHYGELRSALLVVDQIKSSPAVCPTAAPPLDQRVFGLQPAHDSWVAYMGALGQLSDPKLIGTGPGVKQVTDGLNSVKKEFPQLSISDGEIKLIGDLVQLIADVVIAGMREAALDNAILSADPAFQTAIALESRAIDRIYLKDLDSYEVFYNGLNLMLVKSFEANLNPRTPPVLNAAQANARAGCLTRQEANGRVTSVSSVKDQRAAALAYKAAIEKLAKTHADLAASARSGQVLKRSTFEQIKPLLQEAQAAWNDFQKLRS